MNIVFTIIYLILLSYTFNCYAKKKYDKFVFVLLLLIMFSPMMQYVVFPQYKQYDAQGYMYMGFDRVWLEYFLTGLLVLFLIGLTNKKSAPNSKIFGYLILGYILVNIPQFLSSVNLERSFNGFLISVLNPVLYCSIFNKVLRIDNYSKVSQIGAFFYYFFFFMLLSYVTVSLYNVFRGVVVDADVEGSMTFLGFGYGLGIFRDRTIMTPFFMFLPALFVAKKDNLKKKISHYPLFLLLVVITLLISNSRTMYALTVLVFILVIIFDPFKNRIFVFKSLLLLFVVILVLDSFISDNSIFDIIISRFHQKGDTIVASVEEDERFEIWEEAIRCAESSNFFGVGIGNFHLFYIKHFSNAHSLYYSFLAERGIISVIYIICLFGFILLESCNLYRRTKQPIYSVIAIGMLSFALIVYTGDEFLNISQAVFAINPYIIFTNLSVLSNYKYLVNE